MRTLMLAALAAVALHSSHAVAQSATQGFEAFYGNVTATGSGTCSAISGTFPVIANFNIITNTTPPTYQVYVLKFLISGATLDPSPQYLTAKFNDQTNAFKVFDPQLFGFTTGIAGSYTGPITIVTNSTSDTILKVGNASTPVVSTAGGCTITYSGTLYLSPE